MTNPAQGATEERCAACNGRIYYPEHDARPHCERIKLPAVVIRVVPDHSNGAAMSDEYTIAGNFQRTDDPRAYAEYEYRMRRAQARETRQQYAAAEGDGCPAVVMDLHRVSPVIAECGTFDDAERIARALNGAASREGHEDADA